LVFEQRNLIHEAFCIFLSLVREQRVPLLASTFTLFEVSISFYTGLVMRSSHLTDSTYSGNLKESF
jgi:hypothetical protein